MRYQKKKPQSTQRSLRKASLCALRDLRGFFRIVIKIALALLLVAIALQTRTSAHIGSPDVFVEGQAGPDRLLGTRPPPPAIPGVADVDVLATSDDIRDVRIVPLPLTGPGAQFAPVADRAVRSNDDPRLFTGHLWLMSAGAWQVRVAIDGNRGAGTLSVPVPTLPQSTLAMSRGLRATLFVLMLLLATGFVGIISAMAREAGLGAGEALDRRARRRGWIAGAAAAVVVAVIVFLGNRWWTVEASNYEQYVYKPLNATSTVTGDSRLKLYLSDPGWIASRRVDDFVADHGHLMHLFIVSPALDRLWHLHPDEIATGAFEQRLPDVPPGQYELFADLVHATGVSETVTGQLNTAAIHGAPLSGDDSAWSETTVRLKPDTTDNTTGTTTGTTTSVPPTARLKPDISEKATTEKTTAERTTSAIPVVSGFRRTLDSSRTADGGRIVWVRDDTPLAPKRLTMFTFRVEDADGRPVRDLELYMGMPGHAIFVRRDRRVFAHVHPSGSAPMAAMEIAMPSGPAHAHHAATPPMAPLRQAQGGPPALPSTVTFPYGFPEAGEYRIFVQVKRAGSAMTGVFDARVP